MERTTTKSSTHWATWGKRSLTDVPHWPRGWKVQGDLSTLPTLLNCVGGVFILIGWPCSLASRGLGSKVSSWDGPPSMNRKMTFLALAGKCGARADPSVVEDARASSASKLVSATEPKPLAQRRNICRLVRGADKK